MLLSIHQTDRGVLILSKNGTSNDSSKPDIQEPANPRNKKTILPLYSKSWNR
jgi:hypothetical protein